MKRISIDNGYHFVDPEVAVSEVDWEVIVWYMNEDTCDVIAQIYPPCTKLTFLEGYLKLANEDLIIG